MSRTRVFLIAVVIALIIGLAATVAGGVVVRDHSWCDCTSNPNVYYGMYGWPFEWRTNAPYWMIKATEADGGVWGYNREGFSFGRFALVSLMFTTPIVAVESAGFAMWWAWRRRGFLRRTSSA